MNTDPNIYQLNNMPASPSENYGSLPPKRRPRQRPRIQIPLVGKAFAILGALILVAGVVTSRQLVRLDTLSEVSGVDEKADIFLTPAQSSLAFNQEKQIELKIDSNGLHPTGVDFVINFDPSFMTISDPQFASGAFPAAIKSPEIDNTAGTIEGVLVNFEDVTGELLVMTMTARAKQKAGSTEIAVNPDVFITATESDSNVANISGAATLAIVSTSPTPTPSVTPTPTPSVTPTPSPGTTATPTPSPGTSPTPTPTSSPGTSPTPSPDSQVSRLNAGFQIQGINKQDVELPFDITLKYATNANPSQTEKVNISRTIKSNDQGKFWTQAISLEDINWTDVKDEQIEVYVKTDHTLRKKIGTISPSMANNNNAIILNSQSILVAGDFVRGQVDGKQESNKITILDITEMLAVYTDLQVTVNDNNAQFDLDKNGIIDIFDVSIVISNFTDTVIRGDSV